MESTLKLDREIATFGFLIITTCLSPTLSAQSRSTYRQRGFERIYGQEDTYARTVPVTHRQRRSRRSYLNSLRYRSYDGSGFRYSYGRSGRYGYRSYVDMPTYYSSYYSAYYRPWYSYPYSRPWYYRGYYGYPGYYSYYYPGYAYRSLTARSYGYRYGYPGYYRGYGFGYAPY